MLTIAPKKRGRPSKADMAARQALAEQKAKEENISPAERVARIAERFTVLWQLTNGVATGAIRSMIVSGAPGVGKSHTIEELLADYSLKGRVKYRFVRGTVTPINLYKLLWEYKSQHSVLVLDDSDDIFYDDVGLNLMKAALDTSLERRISYLSESNVLKQEGIDTEMLYEGGMIFITNLDFQAYVDEGKNKLAKHFSALKDRSLYLDLKLHTAEDLVAWIDYMVRKKQILQQMYLTPEQENMALDYIRKNYKRMRELSIRTALKIGQFMKMDSKGWESTANVLLLR